MGTSMPPAGRIRRGRFLTALDQEIGANVCIIGADIEDAYFKGRAPGQQIRVGPNLRCSIVGIFLRKGNAFGQTQDLRVVIPLSAFMRTFGSKRGLVVAGGRAGGEGARDRGRGHRGDAQCAPPAARAGGELLRQPAGQAARGFNQMMRATNYTGILVGVITAIVAGIGIRTSCSFRVKGADARDRYPQAVGARRATILWQFLCEAVMVALVGGAVGIALASGLPRSSICSRLLPAKVDPG